MKFYRGSAAAARAYVEADHSRADDYYLAEGIGLAERYLATPTDVLAAGAMDGDTYERWVAGYDVTTGLAKGRLREDEHALRFVEVVVNGPKTWSIAAALHPEIAAAYDAAMDRAAGEVIGYVASTATTRVGPRGRQVQVPVEQLEAAVVRHYTSRAGDPHRHLHLQINARVFARGAWRGLHSVGVVDSIEAINGMGHAAIACDPEFRQALAARGYTLDETGEIRELASFAPGFSRRSAQIHRNIGRYEAQWRAEHPGQQPGAREQRAWDRRAWADARPDKPAPVDGAELVSWWNHELGDLGFHPPSQPVAVGAVEIGRIRRDALADLAVSRVAAKRSAWNSADLRGEVERLAAAAGVVAERGVRGELVEDLLNRATERCLPLLGRDDVPAHIRNLTSPRVLEVEADLVDCITRRLQRPATPVTPPTGIDALDLSQRSVAEALAGQAGLLVIEGAAGTGKTTTLAATATALRRQGRRLVVVTPTLKAAQAARDQVGADAFSAPWLIHQHGHRWDEHGRWTHRPTHPTDAAAVLRPGDVLLVDEAGMLDQDTAHAVFAIADRSRAGLALLGDRHQLPAVGRGGVLDLAHRWAPPHAHLELDAVHRFTDPTYASLSLQMRSGERPADVFDALLARGQILIHPSEPERTAALARIGSSDDQLVIADTRDQVDDLNAAIRDQRTSPEIDRGRSGEHRGEQRGENSGEHGGRRRPEVITGRGESISVGDRVATRRNDRDLGVANRDTWQVLATQPDGALLVARRGDRRRLPADYVDRYVELAYATTAYGAQGATVTSSHLALSDTTGAASAYVAMTRGRHSNTAHLVAETTDEARAQWVAVFGRDRADLGPTHATQVAAENIERYGSQAPDPAALLQAAALRAAARGGTRRGQATTPRPAEPRRRVLPS